MLAEALTCGGDGAGGGSTPGRVSAPDYAPGNFDLRGLCDTVKVGGAEGYGKALNIPPPALAACRITIQIPIGRCIN